ncbi:hypothetical protein GCM10027295_06740 [Pseudaeromonas pectinilytica]
MSLLLKEQGLPSQNGADITKLGHNDQALFTLWFEQYKADNSKSYYKVRKN